MAGCSHGEMANKHDGIAQACRCSSVGGFVGGQSRGLAESMPEMDFRRSLAGAAQVGDVQRIDVLLRKGANANGDDGGDTGGYVPLHYAARQGHVQACRLLIQHGAFVDRRTRSGRATPLHRAAYAGHLDVVNVLLESGADPLTEDGDGHSALSKAEIRGHSDIVKRLELAITKAAGRAPASSPAV